MNRVAWWGICLAALAAGCGKSLSDADSQAAAEVVFARGGTITPHGLTVPVKNVEKLPKGEFGIQRIQARKVPFTDADLEKLKGLTHLEILDLQETWVTDAGMLFVADLKQLKELDLYRTRVGDRGVEFLQYLPELVKLELSYTAITDAGLEKLASLKKLRTLNLYGTRVTKDGLKKLRAALPECKVYS
jgi:Leucine-rich repeat (LRR) protein